MLKIKFIDYPQQAFWLTETYFSMGRNQDNHLVIDHPSISQHHAYFVREGDGFFIQNLSETAATYVNGKQVDTVAVDVGDRVQLGEIELQLVDPHAELNLSHGDGWSLIAYSGWLSGQEFPLALEQNVPITLGRGKKCDLFFPGTHLSRIHAQFVLSADGLYIEDLNSVNGTLVNGEKIVKMKLSAGDRIQIDNYNFLLFGPEIDLVQAAEHCFKHAKPSKKVSRAPKARRKEKMWKTRSTSPGNRQEPHEEDKPFPWTLELIVLTLFSVTVIYLITGN